MLLMQNRRWRLGCENRNMGTVFPWLLGEENLGLARSVNITLKEGEGGNRLILLNSTDGKSKGFPRTGGPQLLDLSES